MYKTRNIRIAISATLVLLLAVLVSCSGVEYGYVESGGSDKNNPSISEVSFSFDWSKLGEKEEVPDDLMVVMSRIVNTVHYVYALDKDGQILTSVETLPEEPVSPDGSGTTEEPEAVGEGAQQDVKSAAAGLPILKAATDTIFNGDYYVMAIAQGKEKADYLIEGVDQFVDSLSISMKDLYAKIPEVPEEEVENEGIVDFNPMYPIIYQARPLCIEVRKQSIYPQGEANNVLLTPQSLVRTMTFKINLKTERGVKIDRLLGIISGVPPKIQLMSGVVSRTETGKMFFDMTEVFSKNNEYIYEGEVKALGLFPATKQGHITGPGILQIMMDASVDGSGGRRFFASINLKETIEKADIMIQTEDHLGYRCTKDAVLEVPTALVVTKEQIISSGGNGLEVWFDNQQYIDTEI